jgi:signal transduction histidine kinase
MWTRKSRDAGRKNFPPHWLSAFADRITNDIRQVFPPRARRRTRDDALAEADRVCTELLGQVEQLARLASEADSARGAAEEAYRANSEFLAMMSHELRTPLNAIIGYLDLLELGIEGTLSSEQQKFIGRLGVNTRHLQALIDNVLDFSKIEAGRMIVSSERHHVRFVVSDAIEIVRPLIDEKGLELVDVCGAPELEYIGDEMRVRQILVNLLSNAVKFTPQGGRITIRAEVGTGRAGAGGASIALTVEDTGVGIPPAEIDAVFEPYVQSKSELENTGRGTGLGLPISRRLARLMEGDLTLRSELGHGSQFTLCLPVAA